jgi:hypothetical protein
MDEFTFTIEQLFAIASGYDQNHTPMSAASVSVIRNADTPEAAAAETQLMLEKAVMDLYIKDGCIVVQIDFPEEQNKLYDDTMKAISGWYGQTNGEDDFKYSLALTIVPMVLQGQFYIILRNPLYYIGCAFQKSSRIALAFPTTHMEGLEGEDINYAELNREVDRELHEEEHKIENKIHETQEEIEQIKREERKLYTQFNDEHPDITKEYIDALGDANMNSEHEEAHEAEKERIRPERRYGNRRK